MGILESVLKDSGYKNKFEMGLSEREAKKRYQQHGPNSLTEKKKISIFKIILDQFSDFMVLILLASTAISMFMGEVTEAITIIAIVILNALLGFIQEFRTERTMEALKELAAPNARVIRGGEIANIPTEQIVPGDLIVLEAGDMVPSDAYIIEASSMQVDESLLTGESVPVEKRVDSENSRGQDRNCCLYMGTIVTSGRGRAVTFATGMNTEMGNIADMIQSIEDDETPLQKRLESLGKLIVYGCLIICAIVSITGVLRGEALFTMLLAGISLAVAAVPEGLPAIVTIALALGVQRMLKRNALVRKLPAVETLGCASVICSDKTGTLTENKMTVRRVYTGGQKIDVTGNGYSPEGEFIASNKTVSIDKCSSLKLMLEICGLCNNARLIKETESSVEKVKNLFLRREKFRVDGDPTEGALLTAAIKGGISEPFLEKNYSRVDEIPFDSDRKCMSVICKNLKGELFVFTKGAPDVIIDKCRKVYTSRGIEDLTPALKKEILKINDSMAGDALRVIGTAYRSISQVGLKQGNVEQELIFVGLLGMIDPPRKEVMEAVQKCRLAGIKPVMITGDHKVTATAIAKELSIFVDGDKVLTGEELERIGEKRLEGIVNDVSVYARVSPKHKLMIVRALKRNGHIVAMTGDGVNDAPAVKEADIGVSMGVSGTDVTKEASAMILMDDNFASIVSAVEEGRVIYNNIRKFIRYMLACNLGEVLTMFLGMLVGLPIPLLPIQILWVNLVTDGLPAVALGFDPPGKDIMLRPPRGSKEHIFSQGLLKLILFRGSLIGLSTLAVFASIFFFTGNVDNARTAAFVTLVITQLIHVFECKSERKTIFEIPLLNNLWLVLAVACSLIMILGVVYVPAFQGVFKTTMISTNDWLLICGFSALGPILSSIFRVNR